MRDHMSIKNKKIYNPKDKWTIGHGQMVHRKYIHIASKYMKGGPCTITISEMLIETTRSYRCPY